jgi:hypothetical protein
MPVMTKNDYSTENLTAELRRFDNPLLARKTKPKKTFYYVMAEFYADGTVKTAVITRVCREKPRNTMRELPFMTAYTDWFESMAEAEAFLAERRIA